MHRYSDMEYVMSLPVDEFLELLATALEQTRREELRQEWLAMLPWMTEDNRQTFEQFYESRVPKTPAKRRSAEDIIADAEAIRRAAKT